MIYLFMLEIELMGFGNATLSLDGFPHLHPCPGRPAFETQHGLPTASSVAWTDHVAHLSWGTLRGPWLRNFGTLMGDP